jgi:hypothetical protein
MEWISNRRLLRKEYSTGVFHPYLVMTVPSSSTRRAAATAESTATNLITPLWEKVNTFARVETDDSLSCGEVGANSKCKNSIIANKTVYMNKRILSIIGFISLILFSCKKNGYNDDENNGQNNTAAVVVMDTETVSQKLNDIDEFGNLKFTGLNSGEIPEKRAVICSEPTETSYCLFFIQDESKKIAYRS